MTREPALAQTAKLLPIQVLRGLASASVLFDHVQVEVHQKCPSFTPIERPWGMGVDVFFVISGLIMVVSSRSLYGTAGAPATFMARRLVRIVPIYWLYTTLALLAVFLVPSSIETMRWDPINVVGSYLFFPTYRWDGKINPLLSLGWTLNYEMFFYFLFAGTVWLRSKFATLALLTLLVALALLGVFVHSGPAPLVFWTRPIILEFGFGVILGWLWLNVKQRPSLWFLVAALSAAFVSYLALDTLNASRALSWGVPAAFIVAGFIWGFPDQNAVRMKPLADWLGESSYSLYLSHPFSVGLAVMLWPLPKQNFEWQLVATAVAAGLIGGILSHRLLERPLLLWMQHRLKMTRPVSIVTKDS